MIASRFTHLHFAHLGFLAAAILFLACTSSARADWNRELLYTTSSGEVRASVVRWNSLSAPVFATPRFIALVPGADGIVVGADGDLLVASRQGTIVQISPDGQQTNSRPIGLLSPVPSPRKLALEPTSRLWATATWSGGSGGTLIGRMTTIPSLLTGSASSVLGIDNQPSHVVFHGSSALYIQPPSGVLPSALGVISPALATTRLISNLPASRVLATEPYSGHLLVAGGRFICQVAATASSATVISTLDVSSIAPGADLVGIAADGEGRVLAAASDGRIVLIDMRVSRVIGNPTNPAAVGNLAGNGSINIVALAPLSGPGAARPQSCVWPNGDADGRTGQLSIVNAAEGDSFTADDLYIQPNDIVRVNQVQATLLGSSSLPKARLTVFADCNGQPGSVIATFESTRFVRQSADIAGLPAWTITFPTAQLWLDGGPRGQTYWLSVQGLSIMPDDFWYWATSKNGAIAGTPGMFRTSFAGGFPIWTSVSTLGCGCTDFAFSVYGAACKLLASGGAPELGPNAGGVLAHVDPLTINARAAMRIIPPTCDDQRICVLRAVIHTNCLPVRGNFELYEQGGPSCDLPTGPPLRVATFSRVTDLNQTTTIDGRVLRSYLVESYDIDWPLLGGKTYWVSAFAIGSGSANQRSYLALADRCDATCRGGAHRAAANGAASGLLATPAGAWLELEQVLGTHRALAISIGVRPAVEDINFGSTAPRCSGDVNRDGRVDETDIFAFLSTWFAGCP